MNSRQRKKFIDWLGYAYLDFDNENQMFKDNAKKEINNKILEIINYDLH